MWNTIKPPTAPNGYASSHDCRVNCSLRSADRRARSRAPGECSGRGARLTDGRCPAGSRRATMRSFAQTCQDSASGIVDAYGPGSPDPGFSPGGLGPHLTSSGFPRGLSSGFPFARRVLPLRPPSSGFPSSGVLRFVPFGRCPGSGSPFGVPPGSLPLSNLHDSAAAGRFRRRWSRAARAKVTSPAATPRLDLAVIRSALQMGSGWARWDVATESPPLTQAAICPAPPRWSRRKRHV